jgi:hypothetical protein
MVVTNHFVQRVKERAMNNRRIWKAISNLKDKPLPMGDWFIKVRHFIICGNGDNAVTVKYEKSNSIRGLDLTKEVL